MQGQTHAAAYPAAALRSAAAVAITKVRFVAFHGGRTPLDTADASLACRLSRLNLTRARLSRASCTQFDNRASGVAEAAMAEDAVSKT